MNNTLLACSRCQAQGVQIYCKNCQKNMKNSKIREKINTPQNKQKLQTLLNHQKTLLKLKQLQQNLSQIAQNKQFLQSQIQSKQKTLQNLQKKDQDYQSHYQAQKTQQKTLKNRLKSKQKALKNLQNYKQQQIFLLFHPKAQKIDLYLEIKLEPLIEIIDIQYEENLECITPQLSQNISSSNLNPPSSESNLQIQTPSSDPLQNPPQNILQTQEITPNITKKPSEDLFIQEEQFERKIELKSIFTPDFSQLSPENQLIYHIQAEEQYDSIDHFSQILYYLQKITDAYLPFTMFKDNKNKIMYVDSLKNHQFIEYLTNLGRFQYKEMFKHPKSKNLRKIFGQHILSINENNLECLFINLVALFYLFQGDFSAFYTQTWVKSLEFIFESLKNEPKQAKIAQKQKKNKELIHKDKNCQIWNKFLSLRNYNKHKNLINASQQVRFSLLEQYNPEKIILEIIYRRSTFPKKYKQFQPQSQDFSEESQEGQELVEEESLGKFYISKNIRLLQIQACIREKLQVRNEKIKKIIEEQYNQQSTVGYYLSYTYTTSSPVSLSQLIEINCYDSIYMFTESGHLLNQFYTIKQILQTNFKTLQKSQIKIYFNIQETFA